MNPAVQIACGSPLPLNTVHAVSVSLPAVEDVIGYEEKRSETMSLIRQGYPRFVAHPYIRASIDFLKEKTAAPGPLALVSSEKVVSDLEKRLSTLTGKHRSLETVTFSGLTAVCLPSIKNKEENHLVSEILSYIQHTGCLVSSRRAEDFLKKNLPQQQFEQQHQEELFSGNTEEAWKLICERLNSSSGQTFLSVSGMNAIYASFCAVEQLHKENEAYDNQAGGLQRKRWIRLGWLYVDNIRILEKYSRDTVQIDSAADMDSLRQILKKSPDSIAGVIVEAPTNPMMEVYNARELKELADSYGFYIIADISVAGSHCVDLLPYADVIVESLTKFASGHGDVMAGAVTISGSAKNCNRLKQIIRDQIEKPYDRDVLRLAYEIEDYHQRMQQHLSNAQKLIDFLSTHKRVREIRHAGCDQNFQQIARPGVNELAVFTVSVEDFASFYNKLPLWKGPSFGTPLTLNMLYMYLAHYELVSNDAGRQKLAALGIDPGLIRISAGTEPIDELIKAYTYALEKD